MQTIQQDGARRRRTTTSSVWVGGGLDADGWTTALTTVSDAWAAWCGVAAGPPPAGLVAWPPDVLALTQTVLDHTDAFRFVSSPPPGHTWPPATAAQWASEVEAAAGAWCTWLDDHPLEEIHHRGLPSVVASHIGTLAQAVEVPLAELVDGSAWTLCQQLMTLHAIADEACAGLFVALDRGTAAGLLYRARGRELLVRTGSLSRLDRRRLRVLPKVTTAPAARSGFARYAETRSPRVDAGWHKIPARRPGTDRNGDHVNLLLLPWPLQVRGIDFEAVAASEAEDRHGEGEGFFHYSPPPLDLDLVERTVLAAQDEVGDVDVLVLPEQAVDIATISALQTLLSRLGVVYLQAGVRHPPETAGRFGRNGVHIGVDARLEKGPTQAAPSAGPAPSDPTWFGIDQAKQYRWSLDENQILQYHLAGRLHPHLRWWEATEIDRPRLELVEVGEGVTLASLICEDLARSGELSELIRGVGPTIVLSLLLDGPQLASRWSARYASVLADDPGVATLTLTSYGMVQRSRPHGRPASSVVGLWKDPVRGLREIELEPGAHGVVLTICGDHAERRSIDGRPPKSCGTRYFDAAVQQVHARAATTRQSPAVSSPAAPSSPPAAPALSIEDLSILTAWAEAVAEAAVHAPKLTSSVVREALRLDRVCGLAPLPPPASDLKASFVQLAGLIDEATRDGRCDAAHLLETVQLSFARAVGGPSPLALLTGRVLRSTIEQRLSRTSPHTPPGPPTPTPQFEGEVP